MWVLQEEELIETIKSIVRINDFNNQLESLNQAESNDYPSSKQSSPSDSTKIRRIVSGSSKNWNECVQAIVTLLPSSYREEWIQCFEQLLHGDGPLPISWRIYIAILALCRHELTWVVRALTFEYTAWDGDKKWLFGIRFAPAKIRALDQINKLLANRPWLVTSEHIADLTKGDESWSLSELCQAICILAHFHALSSFLHSCLPKYPPSKLASRQSCNSLPLTPTKTISPTKQIHPSSLPNAFRHVPSELMLFPKWDRQDIEESSQPRDINYKVSRSPPVVSHSVSFMDDIQTQNKENEPSIVITGSKREMQASSQPNKQSKNDDSSPRCVSFEDQIHVPRSFQHLCSDASYQYEDFPNCATNAVLRIREYNWEDHGFCLVNRLLNDMGTVLDNRFRAIKFSSISSQLMPVQVREALWNYVQSLYGIHHDDYDYSELGRILGCQMETFAKQCSSSPDSLSQHVQQTFPSSVTEQPIKLIPASIVIMDARLQSELLFALRAVVPHQC